MYFMLDGETVEAKQGCCTTGGPPVLILLETGKLGLEFLEKKKNSSNIHLGSSATAGEFGYAVYVVLEN